MKKIDADLIWFFADGISRYERSPMGGMLEKAENAFYSSEKYTRVDADGVRRTRHYPIPRRSAEAWMHTVALQPQAEASYAPDDTLLVRAGSVSRCLLRLDDVHRVVLEAYYGNAGAVHGQIQAVYKLTPAGRAYLGDHVMDEEFEHADDRVAGLIKRAKEEPTPIETARLFKMRTQADAMYKAAMDAWAKVS